jgi:glycosyltransferase involved in cell wall biosynthesis
MAGTAGELTVLIAARNAAATIGRAIGSCLSEDARIVLADDGSSDGTVRLAQSLAGGRLRVVPVAAPGGVAVARQAALDEADTPFAAWLDADDEWVPGRADRLTAMLRSGGDVAWESIDLHDGPTGRWLRRLTTPEYLRAPGGIVRLFERNALPGDTQVAFRTSVFREAGGYDPTLCGPESFDLLLRALTRGARLVAGDRPGYRMHAYPGSVSRNLPRQRAALAEALRKHTYDQVRTLYGAAGQDGDVTTWALVSFAQFRDDPRAALGFLDELGPDVSRRDEIREPDGPWPLADAWLYAFHRGTALLLLHDPGGAAAWLRRAEEMRPSPEGANNLGVALARLGHDADAQDAFDTAAERFSGYRDAALNRDAVEPCHVTTHPLRRAASRCEY